MRWLIAAALAALLATPAAAQQKKMYKCGNEFQDRPCAGPTAPKAVEAPKATPVSAAAEESRKQIRCENYGRQIAELRDREKAEKSADIAKSLGRQRAALEGKSKSEAC